MNKPEMVARSIKTLIEKFGYEAIRDAIKAQKPPTVPPNPPGQPSIKLADDLRWLLAAQKHWVAAGKPAVWPSLMAIGKFMRNARPVVLDSSYATRLLRQLQKMSMAEMMEHKELIEFAYVAKKGALPAQLMATELQFNPMQRYWASKITRGKIFALASNLAPNPKLILTLKADMQDMHWELCRFISGRTDDLSWSHLVSETMSLGNISLQRPDAETELRNIY